MGLGLDCPVKIIRRAQTAYGEGIEDSKTNQHYSMRQLGDNMCAAFERQVDRLRYSQL